MLSTDAFNELANKFGYKDYSSDDDSEHETACEEQSFFKQRPVTRLDVFRQSIGRPHAEIDYDLIAGIIAGMADYSDLLSKHPIKPATGITFVRKNQDRELFNRLFLGSDRKLVVELQRRSCVIYILNRSGVIVCWKTAKHVIRTLHDICNIKARDPDHYAELIQKAHASGWISRKFRAAMEKQI